MPGHVIIKLLSMQGDVTRYGNVSLLILRHHLLVIFPFSILSFQLNWIQSLDSQLFSTGNLQWESLPQKQCSFDWLLVLKLSYMRGFIKILKGHLPSFSQCILA